MAYKQYTARITFVATDDAIAQKAATCIKDISEGMTITAEDLIGFYSYYKKNENSIKPALLDVMRNGKMAALRHIHKFL